MPGNRYLERTSSGDLHQRASVNSSAGVTDANKVISANTSGKLDITFLAGDLVSVQSSNFNVSMQSNTFYDVTTSSSDLTATLPLISAVPAGFWVIIARTGSKKVTIVRSGADTIEGDTSIVLTTSGARVSIISNGTQWKIRL